jgi:hypothetical protein
MPITSHVELGAEDLRALAAATAPPGQAIAEWRALMSAVAFDDINQNTQRVMPAIFANLRQQTDLPERDRVRGAFKYTWSRNTEMMHGVRPILEAFAEMGLDYRILKGAAVQVMCGGLGSRTMGDVDIVVWKADVDAVIDVMTTNGFRRGLHTACSRHADADHHGALNFNKGGCHVDVHIAENKAPVRLLTEMMTAPARRGRAAGIPVLVPQPELLLLHAAVHGRLASGPTDFVQSIVDVSQLRRIIDKRRLLIAARRTATVTDLIELEDAVRAVGAESLSLHLPAAERALARTEEGALAILDAVTRASSVVSRVRVRQRGARVQAEVARSFTGRRGPYRVWLRSGQFARAERAAVRAWGGFLPSPHGAWVSGSLTHPFADGPIQGLTASNVAAETLDWRFRVRFAAEQAHVRLTLNSPSLDTLDTFVFANGVPITHVRAGDVASRSIYFRDLPASVEFSVRPLWGTCTQCYRGLGDLRVQIDLGDDAR